MAEGKVELRRGLRDVYIDRTTSSFIDGKAGKLLYRGYNIDDLSEKSTFEETIYLLLYEKLPTQAELDEFDRELKAHRHLPEEVLQVMELTKTAHPMDVLRTAVSVLATFDPEVNDNSQEATLRKGVRLTAQAPTIVAAHARIREGKNLIAPDDTLNHAANFLNMLFGERPEPEDSRLIDKDFILHSEHGINAPSFGARVVSFSNPLSRSVSRLSLSCGQLDSSRNRVSLSGGLAARRRSGMWGYRLGASAKRFHTVCH